MANIPQYVHDLLNEIAATERFTDHTVEIVAGCNHGDGFLSNLLSVIIRGVRNGRSDSLHLVCKLAPASAVRRREFASVILFQREVLLYDKILPILTEFERSKGLPQADSFTSIPKCYAAIADDALDRYVIILEDVRLTGYKMWPKQKIVPIQYARRLMEQLGKFHAISFALKDQQPAVYEQFAQVEDVACTFFKTNTLTQAIDMAFERALSVLDNPRHIAIVKEVRANSQTFFEDCLKPDLSGIPAVICHGDCWINNLLFRCHEEAPIDIYMVDWQMARIGSPVMDLLYILATSTDREYRQNHYTNLIHHYHQSLSESIRRLGSDPEKLFPMQRLDGQLKRFGKYAFLQGLNMIQMLLADSGDLPDLDALSEDNECKDFVQGHNEATHLEFKQRLSELLTDLIDYGYYWN